MFNTNSFPLLCLCKNLAFWLVDWFVVFFFTRKPTAGTRQGISSSEENQSADIEFQLGHAKHTVSLDILLFLGV